MYRITASLARARISATRAGRRMRRNPLLVMKDGSTIKLAPGKSVTISEEAFVYNQNLINEYSDCLRVESLNHSLTDIRKEDDTKPPMELPPVEVPSDEEETQPPPAPPAPAEEVIEVKAAKEEKPKRRRRKTSVSESSETIEVEAPVEEEKPKRRRRTRKKAT